MRCTKLSLFCFMKSDILIIGAGAAGLMAAYAAAKTLVELGSDASVVVLEKMPRPARKMMITGKGRCNFTNLKDWNDFSSHIRTNTNFVKSAFFGFPPQKVIDFFTLHGMPLVVERGDRVFPCSYKASDVVDTLVNACNGYGVKIVCDAEVKSIEKSESLFKVVLEDGSAYISRALILATGGLSYPSTGSTGDGYNWARELGYKMIPVFPSLTALVPDGYKIREDKSLHIDRRTKLSEWGSALCGIQLKNVGLQLYIQDILTEEEFGDLDFTDGGLEGPIGFQISRKAVKALINGSRVRVMLDLKYGVSLTELTTRIKEIWGEIDKDPRSARLREKERLRILLGKLMPWELIPAFTISHPEIITLERRSRTQTKVWVNLVSIAKALKAWPFDIAGYVGYERAVVTAGGVDTSQFVAKTMESRLDKGLYMCGELMDIDADTGGYNLQLAFSTGHLAGESAAKSLLRK